MNGQSVNEEYSNLNKHFDECFEDYKNSEVRKIQNVL